MNNIKFFTQHEQLKETLPPVPASKFWPQWFKDQGTGSFDTPNREGSNTVKSCPAMLDVLNMGYIIPLWADFKLMRQTNNDISWLSPNPEMYGIDFHLEEQIDAYPFGPDTFKGTVKLINPWQVRTAPGYSCMFVSPYYHKHNNLEVLVGSVDTDRYHEAHVNTFLTSATNEEVKLDYGMPLMQVIPYKREEFKMETLVGDYRSSICKAMQFVHESLFAAQSYRKKLSPKWFK
jgi:hypothetical protein|tara:strand:- start:352 stop:1050 length:699 start_codon:yes stop_codon:yes gene_type:complete